MPLRILLFTLLLAGRCLAADAVPPVNIESSEHRTLRSGKIGHTYELFVSLPYDYATSGKTYPVLYVLDGWHFPLLAFLQNDNIYSGRMPPVIIVNISHGIGINPMPPRARDFTPTHTDDEPTSGGAAAFLDFLEHEVIPLIDRSYRTLPTDRGLLGHSYGGLFALYALVERPGLFQRIIAASPVAGWDHGALLTRIRTNPPKLPVPVRLDLSAGDEGELERQLLKETTAFARLLDEVKLPNLQYRFTVYPGENHNSVRLASFPPALYWLYRKGN